VSTNASNINKPNFQLPENYFVQFGKELQAQIALEEALGGKMKAGFSIPEAYFETRALSVSALSRKQKESIEKTPKVISLFTRKIFWSGLSIAAAAILLISLLWNPTTDVESFDTLDLAEITYYMNNEALAFNTDELAILLSDEAMNILMENTAILDDEQLIEYLEEATDMYQISIE
jgi:hypothetical protein